MIYIYYSVHPKCGQTNFTTVERTFPHISCVMCNKVLDCGCIHHPDLWETSAGVWTGWRSGQWWDIPVEIPGCGRYQGPHVPLKNRSNIIRDIPPLFPSLPRSDEKHRILSGDQERLEPDVIAASAEAWRHNLSFPVNNVPGSDGEPKKVAVSFLRGFVARLIHSTVALWPMGPRARLLKPAFYFLSASPLCSERFNIRFREKK